MKVVLTGGSGKAGRAVIQALLEVGHDVLNVDLVPSAESSSPASRLGLRLVVWASSETTLGLPFEQLPDYAPIDEEHELRPESPYALSKVLGEEMARQFNRWTGIPFVGHRFSNIMERVDYQHFPSFWIDPHLRKWNLWSCVDESHVGQSVRLALEADVGAQTRSSSQRLTP